jgi:preprotein translocase subunit YajC
MWSDAFAQAPGGGSAPPNPTIAMLLQLGYFLPIFLIIYLLIIHPQRKRQKDLEKMLAAVKKGDKVLTSGGIIGTVVGVDGNKAVLRIGEDIKVEFTKSAIVQVITVEAK